MTVSVLALACALAVQDAPTAVPPASTAVQDAPTALPPAPRLFALVFRTGPAWDPAKPPGEQAHFAEHSKNLRDLRAEGRLLLGGRFSDQGLVLVQAASIEEARGLVERDPSVKNGTFRAEVHPFSAFMPGCVGAGAPPR